MADLDADRDRQRRIQEIVDTDVDEDEATWRGDLGDPNGMSDEERVALGLAPWPIPSRRPTPAKNP